MKITTSQVIKYLPEISGSITQVKSVLVKYRKATVNKKIIAAGDVLYLLRGCHRYFIQCANFHGKLYDFQSKSFFKGNSKKNTKSWLQLPHSYSKAMSLYVKGRLAFNAKVSKMSLDSNAICWTLEANGTSISIFWCQPHRAKQSKSWKRIKR